MKKLWAPIIIGFSVSIGIFIGLILDFPNVDFKTSRSSVNKRKVEQILSFINREYVNQVDTDSLLDLTISDLLYRLDPHSTYIPLDEVASNDESIRGSFDGIGIEFRIFKDTLTVVQVIPEGPSAKAGLKAGDRILFADGIPLFGEDISSTDIIQNLKGKRGTEVELELLTAIQKEKSFLKIKRDKVPLKSVRVSFLLDSATAYIKLDRFAETSGEEIKNALASSMKEGARRFVLDLRDNPGGLLFAANEISDEFLEQGSLIVYTKDRQGRLDSSFATKNGLAENLPLIILVNEGSASASEIVAAAIQDNDRGLIIGRRTFGKGLVQEEIELGDGSRVRLTTQTYYTPSGRSIQKPFEDYDHASKAPFMNLDSNTDSVFYSKGGRELKGGGGVNPDKMVAFDTSLVMARLYEISLLENLNNQAFSFVDQNRLQFDTLSIEEFYAVFELDKAAIEVILEDAVDIYSDSNPAVQKVIRNRMKAFIGMAAYGDEAFFKYYLMDDSTVKTAMEAFKDFNHYLIP